MNVKNVLMSMVLCLSLFSVSFAFDPTQFENVDVGNNENTQEKAEFDPSQFEEVKVENTEVEEPLAEFNPEDFEKVEVIEVNEVDPVEQEIDTGSEYIVEDKNKEVIVEEENKASNSLIIVGFSIAITSLILILLLYSIHYYRAGKHLKK